MEFEAVIGLELHIQLLTNSKAYSSDSTEYGGLPNSHISEITLGHPGTLPRSNKEVIDHAIKLGVACGSDIREVNEYARKNYFYADLPKGYQITQDTTPICTGGAIQITLKDGTVKQIGLTRIHMEEDAGKSMHDVDPNHTLVDLNRAGVALCEIVSEPEIRTSDEAYAYVTEVRKLVRYLEICDGNMEEGSMRCDANVSVRPVGQEKFGTRVEVKNMNSIRNVQRAIEFEIQRQIEEINEGGTVTQDTRSFDAVAGTTFVMRSKELANDYRYFPEPDLPPVIVSEDWIDRVKAEMPELPNELIRKFTQEYGLSDYDARVLTEQKEVALFYNALTTHTSNYKSAANWVAGDVKSYLNELALHVKEFPISVEKLAGLIGIIDDGKVSTSIASQRIFPEMCKNPEKDALTIASELDLIQESDEGALEALVDQAIAKFPAKVEQYRSGKKGLVGLFMGEVMKLSKGKADPKKANQLLTKKLNG